MASGNTLVAWGAVDAISATATFDTRAMHLGFVPVLDFDPDADEYAIFGAVMPRHYAGGGVTETIGWMATSATSGTVRWDGAFKSITDDADDLDTKPLDTARSVTSTTASASGEVKYETIAYANGDEMDSVAAGEYFQFQLNRDANNGSSLDTMTGDAELVFVEIRET
jgi:hypothetical protein